MISGTLKTRFVGLALPIIILTPAASAQSRGYLWLGSEYQNEGSVFRYDIASGQIDMVATPPSLGDHFNDVSIRGSTVRLGTPNSNTLNLIDAYTGAFTGTINYSTPLSGHLEGGAYDPATDTFWRITFSSSIHEVTNTGELLQTRSTGKPLVGLEIVGATFYATDYSSRQIGTLDMSGGNATYSAIPWAAGAEPQGSTAGLAYDQCGDVLFMTTYNPEHLYAVTFDKGEAYATLEADLETLNTPFTGLADGLGWVAAPACYPDCDQSTGCGVLDIFDFLCFQDSFVIGSAYACDCDTTTGPLVCDIFDFLCYQDAFVSGCP